MKAGNKSNSDTKPLATTGKIAMSVFGQPVKITETATRNPDKHAEGADPDLPPKGNPIPEKSGEPAKGN